MIIMAKGDKWVQFGVYRRKGDARSAAERMRRDNAFTRLTKVKSGGFKVSWLWSPVKGKKDYRGNPLFRPKTKK